jgi:hypothetical protein
VGTRITNMSKLDAVAWPRKVRQKRKCQRASPPPKINECSGINMISPPNTKLQPLKQNKWRLNLSDARALLIGWPLPASWHHQPESFGSAWLGHDRGGLVRFRKHSLYGQPSRECYFLTSSLGRISLFYVRCPTFSLPWQGFSAAPPCTSKCIHHHHFKAGSSHASLALTLPNPFSQTLCTLRHPILVTSHLVLQATNTSHLCHLPSPRSPPSHVHRWHRD